MKRFGNRKLLFISFLFTLFFCSISTINAAGSNAKAACESAYKSDPTNVLPPGIAPVCTSSGRAFNNDVYRAYGLVVYGRIEDANVSGVMNWKEGWKDPITQQNKNTSGYAEGTLHPYSNGGEYKFLGWNELDEKVNNKYFPDVSTGDNPDRRNWLYRPWLNGYTTPTNLIRQFDFLYPTHINYLKKIVQSDEIHVLNSNNDNKELYNYMNLETMPTVWSKGSGTMYHKRPSGVVWYETFSLKKSTDKQMPDVAASLVSEKGTALNMDDFVGEQIELQLTLKGTLQDDSYYGDEVKEAVWYTRKDHKQWKLKLDYPNGSVTYQESQGIVRDGSSGYKTVSLKLPKSNFNNGDKLHLVLTATEYFEDSARPGLNNYGRTELDISLSTREPNKDITFETRTEEPVNPINLDPIVCSPIIPNDAFDILPFPASDSTDLSRVKSRVVVVDGKPVDPELFFSGRYVFGDGKSGLYQVSMAWERADDVPSYVPMQACNTYRIVVVHNTKPNALFNLFGNSWKENRKMTADNISDSVNDPYVLAHFPITSWSWEYEAVESASDSDRRMGSESNVHKELMYKKPGEYRIKLRVTNSLGRMSDVYSNTFTVLPDYEPAVIFYPYSSQVARNEKVYFGLDAVSTDGDTITTKSTNVYYDSDNNGTFKTYLGTYSGDMTEYTPPPDRLGKYKLIMTVKEDFGQDTLSQFILPSDSREKTVEAVFEVDNYIPYADIFSDVPYVRPQVDVSFMLDKNLESAKTQYVTSNGVAITNKLKLKTIDAAVTSWDLHNYVYQQPMSYNYHTGSSYPPPTYYYNDSSGYSGTLNLVRVINNSYTGSSTTYETVVDVPGHPITQTWCSGYGTDGVFYDHPGGCYSYFSTQYEKVIGYVPTTYKTVPVTTYYTVYDYTGNYGGNISKTMRQTYFPPFGRTTSTKYLAYISDGIVNDLNDFLTTAAKSDAKIILVGSDSIKTQSRYDHFINSSGKTGEQIVDAIVSYIASSNPPVESKTVLANTPFKLFTINSDDEHDTLSTKLLQFVHEDTYFDNSQGRLNFAQATYSPDGYVTKFPNTPEFTTPTAKPTDTEIMADSMEYTGKLSKPGKYSFYHKIMDLPSADPIFASYSYESNEARTDIIVHRKPIAQAALDWTFDPNCNCYNTTWVDQSFDPDHEFSHPQKGIIERKIRYQKDGGEWFYAIPNKLTAGSYVLEYTVKDVELAWSDPFTLNFVLASVPPVQILDAEAKAEDSAFTLDAIPAGENVTIYNIHTRYPFSHALQTYFQQNGTKRTTPKYTGYYNGTKSGDDIYWNDLTQSIPGTLADGIYTLRLEANGMYPQSASYKDFSVTVRTPIRLTGTIDSNGEANAAKLIVNSNATIKADTTKYANQVTVTLYKGTAYQRVVTLSGSNLSLKGFGAKTWSFAATVPKIPDGTYTFEWRATTMNGNTETVTKSIVVLNNRAPIANFDWSPKPVWEGDHVTITNLSSDPDGDTLNYSWSVSKPDGGSLPFSSKDVSIIMSVVGTYSVTLTVSDGKTTHSATKTIAVSPLTISAEAKHTPQWKINHEKEGHNTTQAPKDFYSGEIIVVEAAASAAAVREVTAWLDDTGLDGNRIYVHARLSRVGTTDLFSGELFDPVLQSMTAGLPVGVHLIHVRIEYANGVIKETQVPINIIGNVNKSYYVHRVQ